MLQFMLPSACTHQPCIRRSPGLGVLLACAALHVPVAVAVQLHVLSVRPPLFGPTLRAVDGAITVPQQLEPAHWLQRHVCASSNMVRCRRR